VRVIVPVQTSQAPAPATIQPKSADLFEVNDDWGDSSANEWATPSPQPLTIESVGRYFLC